MQRHLIRDGRTRSRATEPGFLAEREFKPDLFRLETEILVLSRNNA